MFLSLKRVIFRKPAVPGRKLDDLSLPALFLFEFAVVLLGVLAAQGLQSLSQRWAERDRAALAVRAFEQDKADFVDFIAYAEAADPCVSAYFDQLHAIADGSDKPADFAVMPVFLPQPWVTEWDAATNEAVLEHESHEVLEEHVNFERYSQRLYENGQEASRLWGIVRVVERDGFRADPVASAGVHAALGQLAANWSSVTRTARSASQAISLQPQSVSRERVNGALGSIPGCKVRI